MVFDLRRKQEESIEDNDTKLMIYRPLVCFIAK